jgi:hypothetical protein
LGARRLAAGVRVARPWCRMTSSENMKDYTSPGSLRPLAEFYRTRWPDPDPVPADIVEPIKLPERTIPEECLAFTMRFSTQPGTTIFFPHLTTNPRDRKVWLEVCLGHLELTPLQERIFIELVGPRFNTGSKKVKLICDQFQNRIENKRYLIVLIENLKIEAIRLSEDDLFEPMHHPKHQPNPRLA